MREAQALLGAPPTRIHHTPCTPEVRVGNPWWEKDPRVKQSGLGLAASS